MYVSQAVIKLLGTGVSGYLTYVTLKDMYNISICRSESPNYSVLTTGVSMRSGCVRYAVDFDR